MEIDSTSYVRPSDYRTVLVMAKMHIVDSGPEWQCTVYGHAVLQV